MGDFIPGPPASLQTRFLERMAILPYSRVKSITRCSAQWKLLAIIALLSVGFTTYYLYSVENEPAPMELSQHLERSFKLLDVTTTTPPKMGSASYPRLEGCTDSKQLDSIAGGTAQWVHPDPESAKLTHSGSLINFPYYTSDFSFDVLRKWDTSTKDVLEVGGGWSSVWWAAHAKSLALIDDKMPYLCAISNTIDATVRSSSVTYRQGSSSNLLEYMATVKQVARDRSFDIIIVDGEPTRWRCDVLLWAIDAVAAGGTIIADNWGQPQVWPHDDKEHKEFCWCCAQIEQKFELHKYSHSARNGKAAHQGGWVTLYFQPHNDRKKPASSGAVVPLQESAAEAPAAVAPPSSAAAVPAVPKQPVAKAAANPAAIQIKLPLSDKPISVLPGVAAAGWWRGAAAGKWEPETFRAFNQELRKGMVYIGFGEWVGVTGLLASQRASKAIMMDADPGAMAEMRKNVEQNADLSTIFLESRCISDTVGTVTMRANGGSGSSIVSQPWTAGMPAIQVNCLPLPALVEEYGMSTAERLFVKIDTEGAESMIVPSLHDWVANAVIKPTIFLSMHNKADAAQKAAIAKVLNLYPFYAVIKGRTEDDSIAVSGPGVDDGTCEQGVPLESNSGGDRFSARNICNWCDYLVSVDNDEATRLCPGSKHTAVQQQVSKPQLPASLGVAPAALAEHTASKVALGTAASPAPRTVIAMSVCVSARAQASVQRNMKRKHGHAHGAIPFAEAAMLSTQLWLAQNPKLVVLVGLFYVGEVSRQKAEQVEAKLKRVGARVWKKDMTAFPDRPDDACIRASQLGRAFAFESGMLGDNDVLVTSDVDAFPVDANRLLLPLTKKNMAGGVYKIWLFNWIYAEQSGFTIPMSFVAMKVSVWRNALGMKLEVWAAKVLVRSSRFVCVSGCSAQGIVNEARHKMGRRSRDRDEGNFGDRLLCFLEGQQQLETCA